MLEYLAFIGLGLILIGWIYETYNTVKDKHCDIKLTFAIAYFLGSVLLAYHAFSINDVIFIILNVVAALIALINIYYLLFGEKNSKKYNQLLQSVESHI